MVSEEVEKLPEIWTLAERSWKLNLIIKTDRVAHSLSPASQIGGFCFYNLSSCVGLCWKPTFRVSMAAANHPIELGCSAADYNQKSLNYNNKILCAFSLAIFRTFWSKTLNLGVYTVDGMKFLQDGDPGRDCFWSKFGKHFEVSHFFAFFKLWSSKSWTPGSGRLSLSRIKSGFKLKTFKLKALTIPQWRKSKSIEDCESQWSTTT